MKKLIMALAALISSAAFAQAAPTSTEAVEVREDVEAKCAAARTEAKAITSTRSKVADLAVGDRDTARADLAKRERELVRVRIELRCGGGVAQGVKPTAAAVTIVDSVEALDQQVVTRRLLAQEILHFGECSSVDTPAFRGLALGLAGDGQRRSSA